MDKFEPIEIDPKKFLYHDCTLPPLPCLVTSLQKKIDTGNITLDEMVDSLNTDPLLVSQILKVINSAYFNLHNEIDDIQFAIAYFGFNEIRHIILSISVINVLGINQKSILKEFWFHSFYSALCIRKLTRQFEIFISLEGLWSVSVLHDMGKLVYSTFFPNQYNLLVQYTRDNGCLFSDAEDHFSAPKSAYLGALVCDRWGLPGKVRRACEFHSLGDLRHFDGESLSDAFVRMICLGNLIAEFSSEEISEETKARVVDSFISSLGCSESDFLTIMGDIYALKFEAESFIEGFPLQSMLSAGLDESIRSKPADCSILT